MVYAIAIPDILEKLARYKNVLMIVQQKETVILDTVSVNKDFQGMIVLYNHA